MRLAFSKRLGATSSANILFETSIAKTISTPSRFTVSTLVPILGFAKATHSKVITTANSTNFSQVLKLERLGDKRFNIALVANCRCIFRFRHCEATKISSSTNTILMSQRYIFSSI